jgi:hypothetical protein
MQALVKDLMCFIFFKGPALQCFGEKRRERRGQRRERIQQRQQQEKAWTGPRDA